MSHIEYRAREISFGVLGIGHERQIDQVVRAAYRCWAKRYPEWAAAFFDEHFLSHKAAPLLADFVTGARSVEPLLLAGAWADQFPLTPARRQERVAELLPAVRVFLALLATAIEEQKQAHHRWWGWRLWLWFGAQQRNRPLCQE